MSRGLSAAIAFEPNELMLESALLVHFENLEGVIESRWGTTVLMSGLRVGPHAQQIPTLTSTADQTTTARLLSVIHEFSKEQIEEKNTFCCLQVMFVDAERIYKLRSRKMLVKQPLKQIRDSERREEVSYRARHVQKSNSKE